MHKAHATLKRVEGSTPSSTLPTASPAAAMSQHNLAASPHHTAAAASAEGFKKLLIVGLCGEIIEVDWEPEDTVASIKCKAFTAAENALLADARSLVQGARVRTDVTAQAATTLI